jgi:hypothetical protein
MSLRVITGLSCLAGGVGLLAMWRAVRSRMTPERRELRRRLDINLNGRLGDALLTECHENTLYYTYEVRGVQYAASQDISTLHDYLPDTPERLGGMVNMKYAAQNPANSILVCEEWTGLRAAPRPASANVPVLNANVVEKAAALANGNGVGHQTQNSTLA